MKKNIEKDIIKIYNEVFKKVFTKNRINEITKGKIKEKDIKNFVVKFEESSQYQKFAKEFSKKLSQKGLNQERGIWRKFFEAAKESHTVALPETYKEFEIKVMKEAIKHNFIMIKTIPLRMLELYQHKYTETLIKEVAKGTISRGSFYKQLKEHGHKNAKVIARTEKSKLQTAILENRATNLGSVAYVWRSSNDIRTRPSHRAMNDVIVFWRDYDEKPLLDNMRGNAGEFPNCRCTPLPLFDKSTLNKSNYKVYDYRTDKIITMIRYDLINALEKGELQ